MQKEDFYSHLNMKNITGANKAHARRIFKVFETKNLGELYDLYFQSDTLFLADVFSNFWNMCLEIYGRHPPRFLSGPGLAWQTVLKKPK